MNNAEHFFTKAHAFHTQGQFLLSALYADSTLWADSAYRKHLSGLMGAYPQAFEHYTALLAAAKTHALAARQRAYAPFSNFLVGATLIADDETPVVGCNVEASSYGLTVCAERTALVSGVAQGKKRFVCVVVAADTPVLTPPCGACRQMLYDFAPDALVVLVNPHGAERRFTMQELLPEAFSIAFLR
jgi:cytidine deaminase